ncbi:MAG: cobalamin B12-binding domain-containing protein, partial [Chrysiogenales bacterium]
MVPLMKKIVLVAINARYTHSCLALYCLKACVRGDGREVILREYSIRKDPAEIAREIAAECPDAVGLSVYVWNGETMKRIIPALKDRLPEVTLILGGPEAGYNPAQWLRD